MNYFLRYHIPYYKLPLNKKLNKIFKTEQCYFFDNFRAINLKATQKI